MDDNARRRPVVIVDDDEPEAKRICLDRAVMPTPTTTFDSKGDLHLVVGSDVRDGDPSTFLVCSKTLARASPVFDKMLFGPFAESRPSPESSKQESAWVVHLPEDDPNHMEAVLNILHFNFKDIPRHFTPPLFSGMIVIADKYDCIGIFKLWVRSCMPHAQFGHRFPPKFALHIAWQLGSTRKFKQAMAVIVDQSFISGDGGISIMPKAWDEDEEASDAEPQDLCKYLGDLVPAEIVDQIRDQRAKLINAAMEPFITLHEDLANSRERCPIPAHQEDNAEYLGKLRDDILKALIAPYLEIYKTLAQRRTPEQDLTFHACLETDLEEDERLICEKKDFEYRLNLDSLTKLLRKITLKTSDGRDDCAHRIDHRIQESHREEERLIAEADIIRPEHLQHIHKQAEQTGLDENNKAGGAKD
ncbi:hypothetical protein K4K61_003579 [Colletotrichum sp. SAR11_59]|nr:hypothetical protein K4K61_003579 [Colletotrichum sp. SAR11_59]